MPRSAKVEQAPAIRPTQFENSNATSLKSSVNLFRGDVNFQKTLATLPGKFGDNTLEVQVNILYESNVTQQVTTWNLDAPTGILGLGWSLSGESISANSSGALSQSSLQYEYQSGGTGNQLYGNNEVWVRGFLKSSLAAYLNPDITPAEMQEIVAGFAAVGLLLDASATVQSTGENEWTLDDPVNEHLWNLSLVTDATKQLLQIADGGQSFELQSYQFWKIFYYPKYERWELTNNNGALKIFGGGLGKSGAYNISNGNSVEWGVTWDENGSWNGSSSITANQEQYATAWNLYAKVDRYGDQVTYEYNGFERVDGLISMGAEQLVSVGGMPYTKACYITSITDAFGRRIVFNYKYKTFTAAAQEYADPHFVLTPATSNNTPPANLNTPTSFQDRYEVLLLENLEVQAPTGSNGYELVFGISFNYAPPQNISTTPAEMQAVMCKSYLQEISWYDAANITLPGYVCDYYLESSEGPNLGSIKSITYPEGSTGTFTYGTNTLPICDRSQVVTPPDDLNVGDVLARGDSIEAPSGIKKTGAQPRVWFGEDYAVTVWISQDLTQVSLEVHTWVGHWVRWSPTENLIFNEPGNFVDATSFQLIANQNAFVLAFNSDNYTCIYPFNRDPQQTSKWAQIDYDGATRKTFADVNGISLAAGNEFVVALVNAGTNNPNYSLYCFTFNWRNLNSPWSGFDNPLPDYDSLTTPLFVLAQNEYYLVLSYDKTADSTLNIYYLDQFGNWNTGGQTEHALDLTYNEGQQMMWSAGASCAAFAVAQTAWSSVNSYTLTAVRWDANYDFVHSSSFPDLSASPLHEPADNPVWPPTPRIIGNEIVGCLGTICRFNGSEWQNSTLPPPIGSLGWAKYAYGQDFTLQVVNSGTDIQTYLLPYNPQADGFGSLQENVYDQGLVQKFMGYPSAVGEDYFCAANGIFYRGSSTSWDNAFASPVYQVNDQIDTVSLINESPNFMAYLVPGYQAENTEIQLLILQNGGVTAASENILKHENYFTTTAATGANMSPSGQIPAGENAFATFPARYGQFHDSPFFILRRYAGFQLKGPVIDYPVQSLAITVFGGDEIITTCYEYDGTSAACDPSGETVKYYQSATYDGCDDPSSSAFGRTVNLYYNGISEGYSMLDGQPIQTVMFEGAALFATKWQDDLGLDPAQSPNQGPVAVSTALATLFAQNGVQLSPSATIEYLKIGSTTKGYCYWQIEDPDNKAAYNLDYNHNPRSASGVKAFTGRVVQYSANDWEVFDKRNGNAHTPDPIQLHGAYALPVTQTTFQDGVGLTTTYGYCGQNRQAGIHPTPSKEDLLPYPFTGGVQQQAWSYYNVKGELESYIQEATFGAEVYPQLEWGNVLTPTAQLRIAISVDHAEWLTISSTANTWSEWVSTQDVKVCDTKSQYIWKGDPSGKDTGNFPFHRTPPADLWNLQNETTVRNGGGVVTESIDSGGLTHSTILDKDNSSEIVVASNASYVNDEVAYCGFEEYESVSAWTFSGGADVTDDNAHTGSQSLYLPSGATAQFEALSPGKNDRVYIVSCWYQVTSAGSNAALTIQITQNGAAVGDDISVAFNGAIGNWHYAHAPIDLAAYQQQATGTGALSINLSLEANDATGVWVDDVSFAPRACAFTAQVHDPLTSQTTAKLSVNGKTYRMLYDSCFRLMGTVGVGERLRGLKTVYYSRQGNPGGFNTNDPNAKLKVKAQHGGSAQTFLNGNGWQNDWTPDDAAAWNTNTGLLVHSSANASNTLTSASAVDRDFAVYFDLFDSAGQVFKLASGFELRIGSAASIAWNGSEWTLTVGDSSFASLCTLASPPVQILLLLTGDNLIFYANGQLVFSQTANITGVPQIVTGNNALALRNLSFLIGPSLQLSQQDEAGNDRQTHVLAGNSYFVNQVIGDAAGNRSMKTKAIPGDSGNSGKLPPLQYRSTLVDLAAFQNTVNTTGVMTGDVADYYDGTNGTTNDQQYPYTRYRYEASPLNRIAEVGSAGAGYAIIENVSFEQRTTVRLIRSANDETTLRTGLKIPAGQYRVTTRLDQANSPSLKIFDAVSNQVASLSGSKAQWVINTTAVTYTASGSETQIVLPNSFLPGDSEQSLSRQYNGSGQLVSESDPDSGTTNYIYNSFGQVRFVQDAEGEKKGFAIYLLYDELGRRVSRGVLQTNDFPSLQSQADSLTFPEKNTDNVTYQTLNVWLYDGDGTDANALGNLVRAVSYNNGTGTVTEEKTWDDRGLLKSRTLKTEWTDDGSIAGPFTLNYEYDAQGHLVYIGYPDLSGVSLKGVVLAYGGMGQLAAITDQDKNVLASYQFNANGQAVAAKLGAAPVAGRFGYDSPGHFCDVSAAFQQNSFSTTAVFNAAGTVKTQSDEFENASTMSGDYDLSFDYALQNQLGASNSATASLQQTFGYVDPTTNAPDLNGNIHAIEPPGDTLVYQTANQLEQVEWGGGGTTSFVYNADGSVQSRSSQGTDALPDLQFVYLPGTTLPASITLANGNVAKYIYDSNGMRAGKRVYDGTEVSSAISYIPGPLKPFAQIDQTGNAVAYVYGINGLIAMFRDDDVYSVITDRLGSTRMIFDSAGSVAAAYNYQSFGSMAQSFEPSAGWMPLLFTGQEFDTETGLYNLNARLYDPLLGRLYQPDPVPQYPSPYTYTGNHPNIFTDPTGMVTQGEQAGLADVLLLGYAIGFGITFLLAPEASPLLAAGLYALSGAITGFSSAGLTYDVEHNPSDWSWSQFFEVAAIGAVTGAVGGAISGGVSQIGVRKAAKSAVANTAESLSESGAGDVVEDGVQNQAVRETSETTSSRAKKSWQKEKSSLLYKLGGRVGGYAVSGFTYTIGTNLVYSGNVGSAASIIFWTGFSVAEGLGATVMSVAGGVAEDTFQISSMVKDGVSGVGSWAARDPELSLIALIGTTTVYVDGAASAFVIANNAYNAVMAEFGSSGSSSSG